MVKTIVAYASGYPDECYCCMGWCETVGVTINQFRDSKWFPNIQCHSDRKWCRVRFAISFLSVWTTRPTGITNGTEDLVYGHSKSYSFHSNSTNCGTYRSVTHNDFQQFQRRFRYMFVMSAWRVFARIYYLLFYIYIYIYIYIYMWVCETQAHRDLRMTCLLASPWHRLFSKDVSRVTGKCQGDIWATTLW